MKMKNGWSSIAASLALTLGVAHAEETAIVLQDNVNVRGQAAVSSEVITRLKKGEAVTVLETVPAAKKPKAGEPSEWLKIAMPTNTPVWVNAEFLDANADVVSARRLNVRSGPGENFSVVGRMLKGDPIHVIRKLNGWAEIEAPTNSYAFVAADLVSRSAATPAAEPPKPITNDPVTLVANDTKPAGVDATPVTPAATATVSDPAAVTAATTATVAANNAASTTAPATSSVTNAGDTAKAVDEAVKTAPEVATTKTPSAPEISTPSAKPAEVLSAPTEPPAQKRVVSREGVVRRTVSIQAPTGYRLENSATGKTMDYLHYPEGEKKLKPLLGHTVSITGEEVVDRRWPSTPIVEIETIELR
jgi:uncharacterized protein YgiM (DUF1202 family)